jgi:EmrB/QacA subfamily drug resistance transporter
MLSSGSTGEARMPATPSGAAPGSASAPEEPRVSSERVWVIFIGLMLAMLLAALDQTIVATALPTIVADLGGAEHLSWVVTSYMLASTVTTPLWGKVGDLFGRRTVFLVCIVIFLIGSGLAGTSQDMWQLVLYRAIQGAGGGGLMVLAQAIIGDVVPPRDRGRYQGIFGAVFGVASVAGPLLGGFFVDNLSWQWVFYVNLPIGVVALAAVVLFMPATRAQESPRVDYAGIILLGIASTTIVMVTSFGGTTWDWVSLQIAGLVVLGIVCLIGFIRVESRVPEPVLPLGLFANPVFRACSGVGFVVGFAMFGSITYLPLYLQRVGGANATESGLQMLPMMLGLLLTSTVSGQVISRTGRYRAFPIAGCAVFTVALYLLSTMGVDTSDLTAGLFMFVLGVGLGMVMQVLVLAVQNSVDYQHLGTATSGVTFFRTIGSSVGVAVFGAVFSARLSHVLTQGVPTTAGRPVLTHCALRGTRQAVDLPAGGAGLVGRVVRRGHPHGVPGRGADRSHRVRDGLADPRAATAHHSVRRRRGIRNGLRALLAGGAASHRLAIARSHRPAAGVGVPRAAQRQRPEPRRVLDGEPRQRGRCAQPGGDGRGIGHAPGARRVDGRLAARPRAGRDRGRGRHAHRRWPGRG